MKHVPCNSFTHPREGHQCPFDDKLSQELNQCLKAFDLQFVDPVVLSEVIREGEGEKTRSRGSVGSRKGIL